MKLDIIRAWKDEGYRWTLSEEERHALPENPIGELELTDADLEAVIGGGESDHGSDSDSCGSDSDSCDSDSDSCDSGGD